MSLKKLHNLHKEKKPSTVLPVLGIMALLALALLSSTIQRNLPISLGSSIYESASNDCQVFNGKNCNLGFIVPGNLSIKGASLVVTNTSGSSVEVSSIDIFGKFGDDAKLSPLGGIKQITRLRNGTNKINIGSLNFFTSTGGRVTISLHSTASIAGLKIKLALY